MRSSRWPLHGHEELLSTAACFLLIFFAYMATPPILVWGDTLASRYLPISIIRERNFDLNEFDFPYDKEIPYFLQYRGDRLLSSYPVGAALAAVPFYLAPVLIGMTPKSPWIPFLEKFSAASLALLSALFLYLALRRLTTHRTSVIVTAIYALGTSTFSISSQALWQHGPSQFFLALGFFLLIQGRRDERTIAWSGFPLGMAVVCRPTNLFMLLPVVAYLCFQQRKSLLPWIIYAVPPAAFVLTYNHIYFGSIFASGYGTGVLQPFSSYWSTPFFYGLFGVLISPSKGLLTYSPILLFAFIGIYFAWMHQHEPLLKYLSLGPILVLLTYSKWHFWWGGEAYGPRLIADMTPLLCVYLYPVWEAIEHRRLQKMVFGSLAVISVCMHTIGAFGFDPSWYKKDDVTVESDRLWSFNDSPFVHYGKKLLLKNVSFLRTGMSSLPTSPQIPQELTASLVHQEVPSRHTADETIRLSVAVINTGPAIWLFQTHHGQNAVRFGWRWFSGAGEAFYSEGRAPLLRDVFPGERAAFHLSIWPPSAAGEYVLELGMISEPTTWFGLRRLPMRIEGGCHFEEVMAKPLTVINDRPRIDITAEAPSYRVGEIGTIHLRIVNGAVPRNLRLLAFLKHPDGHLRSLNAGADLAPDPPCSQWLPKAAPHILSKHFQIDWQLGLRLNHMPDGMYTLYALMIELGSADVVAKSSSTFHLLPSSPPYDENNTTKLLRPPTL